MSKPDKKPVDPPAESRPPVTREMQDERNAEHHRECERLDLPCYCPDPDHGYKVYLYGDH